MAAGGKTSKKRVAPSQAGPKPKKIHSEKPPPPTKNEKPGPVKRGRPVTLPQTHDSDTSFDEEAENLSESVGAELTDEDDEMLDAPTKDPNGGRRV